MKRIGKIQLSQLSKNEMERRKINALRGGASDTICVSRCGCLYSGDKLPGYYGGSNTIDNGVANGNNAVNN